MIVPSSPNSQVRVCGGPTADDALQFAEVSKQFDGVSVLRDINLSIRPGEVHGLVGENGAGKSTLMNIAAGTLRASSGKVSVGSSGAIGSGRLAAMRHGLRIVYQEPALFSNLTVAENILFDRSPATARGRAGQDAVEKALDPWTGVSLIDPTTGVHELDSEQRTIVEISRAFVGQPKVILLDEPTEHLSAGGIEVLFGLIEKVVDSGCAVVYISHRIPDVKRVSDRISVLRDGELVGTHDGDDIEVQDIVSMVAGREIEGSLRPDAMRLEAAAVGLKTNRLAGDGFGPVDLEVRRGEILGVAGIEGHGQRQFLRALAGLDGFSGEVAIDGQASIIVSVATARDHGISYLTNDRLREGLLTGLSVNENITIGALGEISRFGFLVPRSAAKLAQSQTALYGIKAASIEAPIETLSGGNQQKAMLSRVMLSRNEVLLVDEPTQGVDVGARADIYAVLRAAASDGAVVIALSSDVAELEHLSDRVAVFSQGRVASVLEGDALTERNIAATMLTTSRASRTYAKDDARHASPRTRSGRWRQSGLVPSAVIFVLIGLLGAIAAAKNPAYLTSTNMSLVLPLLAVLAVVSMGQQVVLLIGGFDLSVGPLMGLSIIVASFLLTPLHNALGLVIGLSAMVLVAAGVGVLNWALITFVGLGPMIATLAMFMSIQGLSLLLRPEPGGEFSGSVSRLMEAQWGFVPYVLLGVAVVAVGLEVALYRSNVGIRLRALGQSASTAQRVGLSTRKWTLLAYVGCALLAGLAALLWLPQIGAGDARAGTQFTLMSVGAAVLGGASIYGGRASFIGAFLGAALIVQIMTVVQFVNIPGYMQEVLLGSLTIVAAVVYMRLQGSREVLT